jgi:TonB family protein
MNIREQFGKYLLLKKLAEDALGETFRAGRIGAHGMEQVALLRVFNGAGIDAAALTGALNARRDVQKALVSPNVGNGVDLGEVRGVPFVAYDYISGKDLASLQEQAKRRNHPIPSDHALLIAERIALALAVGYETRLGEDRVLHGAALPQLVMISNEGETRLLGFEAAPGLRQIVRGSAAAAPLARYLSPEARAGAAPHKADDVYSVAAILLELLTGEPIAATGDLAAAVDAAEMQSEGTPLPDDLKKLLKASLAPQAQRISDVITWHKALSRMMFEGQYNPTTFNLAFFMHNLFRDEIEKESREIEVEKTMELPASAMAAITGGVAGARDAAPPAAPPVAAAGPGATPVSDLREATGVRQESAVFKSSFGAGTERRSGGGKMKMILGAAAAVLLIGGAVGFFVLAGDKPSAAGAAAAGGTQAAGAGATVPAAAPDLAALQQQQAAAAAAAEQARLEELYRQMLEKQSKDLEERYRAQFDSQLATLRKDLDSAKQRTAEAQAAAATVPRRDPEPARETAAIATPRPAPAQQPAQAAVPPPAAPPVATQAAPAPAPVQEPAPAQAAVAQPSAPAAPSVNRGDLVTPGPGVSMPRLQVKPRPTYPAAARSLRKEATIVVRVLVDENGRVAQVELKGREVGFGMDHEALRAARGARFSAATKDGVPVRIWLDLPIEFRL